MVHTSNIRFIFPGFSIVQFVKRDLLGDRDFFLKQYVKPATTGQYKDSPNFEFEALLSKFNMLKMTLNNCIHRRDESVLEKMIPPRYEFTLYISFEEKHANVYEVRIKTVGF